ncbi:MAG TPA: fatty acid desaturase [Gaiellaceae bacterium]|nr:fatty acid desaturase [Gaiellaceae bacterium]
MNELAAPNADESWRKTLAPYMAPSLRRSLLNLATSVCAYLALVAAMYFALRVSDLLVLALALPAAGFLIRTFIVFHDCAHASFLPSKRANAALGAVLGVLLWFPFQAWRYKHAVHHATSGDLDRRGVGDVQTLTIDEYRARPWWGRLGYRLFRNPLVMFGLGPLWVVVIGPRLVSPFAPRRIQGSVLGTDLALVLVCAVLWWLLGWEGFLLVQVLPLVLTGAAGIWLFYVQHQFEDAYWQTNEHWDYDQAALEGSSYLKLPRILRFFTGNIGLHHVHHLSARIPNYNLQRAHDETAGFGAVPTLTLWDGLRAVRLKLWDERQHRLVTFRQARAGAGAAT